MTNQIGSYDFENREYVINLANNNWTPRPWSNIITNKDFGTLVTATGASFTWFLNSALFRLTPWVNDPVSENSGELLYLTDETTSEVWSPMLLPLREKIPYEIRHGLGYTTFTHNSHQILQKVKIFVHKEKPTKYIEVSLKNLAKVPRKMSLSYYCQWVLGAFPDQTNRFLWTGENTSKNALIAKVLGNDFRSGYTAYLTCDGNNLQLAKDRGAFFLHKPSNDPCAVLKKTMNILPGQEVSAVFFMGIAKDADFEKEIKVTRQSNPKKVFLDGQNFWQQITKGIIVDTPDSDLNILFNDRLVYQSLTSRLWGRVGMYQPGGAYGFRDQLQDSLAFVWTQPSLTREQILRAAATQLPTGEVMQWWHPPENFGAVSASSDGPLWLVYAATKYYQVTGDKEIFKEGNLYEHCLLAIERTLSLLGPHGFPLILSGDWNDSLDNIGPNKHGESIWLSLFLSYVLDNFSKIGEKDFTPIAKHQAELVEKLAWKDDKFIRAFADDGREIDFMDSIVQSWAVICGLINKDLRTTAVSSARGRLIDRKNGVVKLLDPSIPANASPYLGYIQQYPQGVRENGGFYCHAAVWLAWALCLEGDGDGAMEIINMINPFKRDEKYLVEPYVLASDIHAGGSTVGQGGWSWYTGSAATLYCVLVEEVFGLKLRSNILTLDPCIPKNWPEVTIKFRNYQIKISNPDGINKGVKEVLLDGTKVPGKTISFDGQDNHQVVVVLG